MLAEHSTCSNYSICVLQVVFHDMRLITICASTAFVQLVRCAVLVPILSPRADTCPLQPISKTNIVPEAEPFNDGTNESPGTSSNLTQATDVEQIKSLRSRASFDKEDFATAIAKGRALWDQLERVLYDRNHVDEAVCDLDARWDVRCSLEIPVRLNSDWYPFLPQNVIPTPMYKPQLFRAAMTAPKGRRDFTFVNSYWPAGGAIVAETAMGLGRAEGQGAIVRAPVSQSSQLSLSNPTSAGRCAIPHRARSDQANTKTC